MKFIIRQYRESFSHFKNSAGKIFILCLLLFALIGLAAAAVGLYYKDAANNIMQFIIESIQKKNIINEQGAIDVVKLFFNNLAASAIAVCVGFIPFLFLPVIYVMFLNSAILGITYAYMINSGQSPFIFFISIAPHGIFELAAVIYAIALGTELCFSLSRKIAGREIDLNYTVKSVFRAFVTLIIPLLVIAAVIEAYVTPDLSMYFRGI
jgi:stage II sporulation protein M